FFGKYELPSFKVPTISRLEVLVVHTIGKKEREKCDTESIKILMKDAKLRGLKVVCYDDPDDVRHILCTDHPNAEQCRFKGLLGDGQDYR
ncbi:ADP-ribosyl cyclase/cyclic ADP-ribose hydrolase, partial [Exaiptasia diaphana]